MSRIARTFLHVMASIPIQTLITATDGAYFPADGPGVFYQVQAGKVS